MQKMVDGIHVFLTASSNETIYYSLGGEYKQYSVPIVATENSMILAYAIQPGCIKSETVTQDIEISVLDTPTISTPSNNTIIPQNTAVLIRWSAAEGALGYDLIVATVYKGNNIKINNGLPILRRDTAQTRLRAVFL